MENRWFVNGIHVSVCSLRDQDIRINWRPRRRINRHGTFRNRFDHRFPWLRKFAFFALRSVLSRARNDFSLQFRFLIFVPLLLTFAHKRILQPDTINFVKIWPIEFLWTFEIFKKFGELPSFKIFYLGRNITHVHARWWMKKWNTISGDFRTKDVSRGMIDSQGRGNENDLANSGETEQSFHGFGFIVDPGTKLARTWRKRATRIQLVLLFSLFSLRGCPAEEPIAFRSARPRGLKYFHGEEEEEEEISLFMGKMEFARDPGRNNFDSRLCPVSREHTLSLNKFPPTRNSIVYFPFRSVEKREICRGYCSRIQNDLKKMIDSTERYLIGRKFSEIIRTCDSYI